MGVRVYELARTLGLSSKALMHELKKQGIDLKSHMSSIDDETAELVVDLLKTPPSPAVPEASLAPAELEPPTAVSVLEPPAPVTQQAVAPSPAPPPPVVTQEPTPGAVVEPAKVATPVEAPPSLKAPSEKRLRLGEAITVKELAEKLEARPAEVIKVLIRMGVMATINAVIDLDKATALAQNFGYSVEAVAVDSGEALADEEDSEAQLVRRAPVVTVMGHVDHGKTSLLDAIRATNVTQSEAGGITQHIGAYEVNTTRGKVVFLDTPGHEAFTAMRARGAQATDIVVLVVAADDGVMPQTVEAITHARAANVPIVVAINKIDLPNANPDRIKQQLTEHGLVPEQWGGETIYVEVSAKRKQNIDELLEMLLLQAEILELRANPSRRGQGVVIEAELDKTRGPVATVLVQKGTVRIGDAFVVGMHYGRIRALLNDHGEKIQEAGPATPVEVIGLSGVPLAGDAFQVVVDEKKARQIATLRQQRQREEHIQRTSRVTLEDLYRQIKEGEVKELNVLIKADVQGSAQAVRDTLEKLSTTEVRLRVIQGAVGGITESDVMLASASNAILIGFNVRPTPKARELAEREGVDVRLYTIIYDLIADVKAALEGLLEPEVAEHIMGRAEVRETFHIPRVGVIAGCYVTEGSVTRNAECRLLRDNVVVYQGRVASLRRFKEDVHEVNSGYECGIGLERFSDLKRGDVIEPFVREQVAKKLAAQN
ncbi:MAG TPA: translation initiation factor IF-2 [Candidatus Tectomicrobia bacterium]|nr:translation initiation factor IF-2 [Candidatus Tectomicrobia bacterium]